MIVDTHIDAPFRLTESHADLGLPAPDRDFDWPRAVAGGLDVAFLSIYVPASYQKTGGARRLADELIDMVERIAAAHPDKFLVVRGVADARQAFEAGKVGLALGIENGAALEGDPAHLVHFRGRGVRYVTLAHGENNLLCDSSYAAEPQWSGLSPLGREVVAAMNDLGMMVDVSHVTDETVSDVLELSRVPVIASHSSCRHFTPGWERNVSDELIRRIAAGGGVVQINFGSSFLDDAFRRSREAARASFHEELVALGIDRESEEARRRWPDWARDRTIPVVGVERVADHIDHVVRLVGIDHVGLGSDFDGVGETLPRGLEDVSGYPNLIAELLRRGYSEADVERICSGNLLRVWTAVERAAVR
jgi:membrane dipeptidase